LEGCFKRPTTRVGRHNFDKIHEEKLRIVNLETRPSSHTVWKALATTRKTTPVNLFSPKFLDTLSIRRVSCSAVVFGSETKLLIAQQQTPAYFEEIPGH
jgi:hypothetical protein